MRECNVIGCERRAVCSTSPDVWWCANHYDEYEDSDSIGYYGYDFPVDALELPE